MEKRFILFLALSFAVIVANMFVMRYFQPQQPAKVAQKADKDAAGKDADDKEAGGDNAADKVAADLAPAAEDEKSADAGANDGEEKLTKKPAADVDAKEENADAAPAIAAALPEERYTLGSCDPASGYRQLITLVNRGAAIERIELNSPNYLDQEDRSGYVGQLDLVDAPEGAMGALVRVVGPGTPAAEAGVAVGDTITELNGKSISGAIAFEAAMETTEPGDEFHLGLMRDDKPLTVSGKLRRRPMQIVRPESSGPLKARDPLSFLLTIDNLDGKRIADDADELPGVDMYTTNWQVLPRDNEDEIAFAYDLTSRGLQIVKRFKLAKVDPKEIENPTAPAYHLDFSIEVRNLGDKPHEVAWRLEGPTGLPLEGAWYAMKIGPNWRGGAGMRDVVVGFWRGNQVKYGLVSASTIASDKDLTPWQDEPIEFLGVDSQYFAVALTPPDMDAHKVTYDRVLPIRVGELPAERAKYNRTNVSFRLTSKVMTVEPEAEPLRAEYKIFAGPKKPQLLAQYGLGKLVYYGMFGWVSEPMLAVLHMFYRVIPNYGIAIILLTVLVRSMMLPISRRQAANAAKMQELQPEMKRIQEKYKSDMEGRSKAQQELFRKHNYNPLAGCLPVFLQLPIFIGLYRSLAVDVELRGAPLFSESIRWCSNLAAPDMLWHWESIMPAFVAGPNGWLGPYFNLFPCISAALFIVQQRKMMPPPTDEQSAMQQKVMQYMTVFIGIMFFKVASGLCLYLISSSVWSMTERMLLPKKKPAGGTTTLTAVAKKPAPRNGSNGSADTKRKNRGRT